MSPLGSVNPLGSSPLTRIDAPVAKPGFSPIALPKTAPGEGFGQVLDGLVGVVQTKQTQAAEITRRALLGEGEQLHQSVIAMQEAGVAFSMMVEVRNKLVESYQELMRMQV